MRTPNFSQYAEGAIKNRARKKKQISWGHCQSRVTKKHLERNTCWTVEDRCFSCFSPPGDGRISPENPALWALGSGPASSPTLWVCIVSFIECLMQHIWLVVWTCLEHVLWNSIQLGISIHPNWRTPSFFPYLGNFIIPTDSYFSEGYNVGPPKIAKLVQITPITICLWYVNNYSFHGV